MKKNAKATLIVGTGLLGAAMGLSRLPAALSIEQGAETGGAKDQENLVTMEFGDVDVSQALSLLEETTPIIIVFGSGVTGKIEKIKLVEVTPEKAMQEVAKAAGLKCFKIKEGGYVVENPSLSERSIPLEPFD